MAKSRSTSPFSALSCTTKGVETIHKTACGPGGTRKCVEQDSAVLTGAAIPFNGNLLSRCSANDQVLGGPRFHEFSHTRFGTIERPNAGAAMGPVSVNPENVEWQKHLFDRGIKPQTANGGKSRERKEFTAGNRWCPNRWCRNLEGRH